MIRNTRQVATAFAAAAVVCSTGCTDAKDERSVQGESAAGSASDTSAGVTGMPGMTSSAASRAPGDSSLRVVFTAAQVAHGGVRWARLTVGLSSAAASVPGEVTPNEDRTVRLGAPAGGRILQVLVQPGDRVLAGRALVTLQSPEAGLAQSDVAKAEAETAARRAEAEYATSARARAERLLALKAIPRQEYERSITDDERARAAFTQARAEERRARGTAVQLGAGGQNGRIVLRAPAAGVVLERTAFPGAVVETGAPLVVVSDPTSLWLVINAPESMAASFRKGGTLRFSVPAYAGDTFNARVDVVGASLDVGTRTLGVRATVTNGGPRLKAGMLANVIIDGGVNGALVTLPDNAVQTVRGRQVAFVAQPDGKGGALFEARDVETGMRGGGSVAIARGLAVGDVVVVAGAFAVKAELEKAGRPRMEM
ncbi:MAG: efflux RND transporter periplasmic adaptor subunit [Gemmatimonas sp.]